MHVVVMGWICSVALRLHGCSNADGLGHNWSYDSTFMPVSWSPDGHRIVTAGKEATSSMLVRLENIDGN